MTSTTGSETHKIEMMALYLSTFLLRTGFGGAILLVDWILVWGFEHANQSATSGYALTVISLAAITYYIAEITLTGYYGSRSDKIGAKPVLLYSTIGAGVVLLLYSPGSLLFMKISNKEVAVIILALYIAMIHFLHGVFASANVAPSLGFVNKLSTNENRALHMAWYDNAILYGRAAGIVLGGLLWIGLNVDGTSDPNKEAHLIAYTFPFLALLLVFATLLVIFGIQPLHESKKETHVFNIKRDIAIAAKVMLKEERRPMLIPWVSIAALIGSASLWGPTVSFIATSQQSSERGWNALLPIMIALVGLALPAPLWGIYADRKGRKKTLLVGLIGLPLAGVLGLAIGFPFYRSDLSIHNWKLLVSLLPGAFMFSALIPVLMGILGDTAEDAQDGEIMSGYHFVIAAGETVGVIGGGIFIGFFSLLQSITGIFGSGTHGNGVAVVLGFILFEMVLVTGMFIGILRLPEQKN